MKLQEIERKSEKKNKSSDAVKKKSPTLKYKRTFFQQCRHQRVR